jgi:hypothetical protein
MLIAVDTNVLFDLASDVEAVVDAVATIRARLSEARFIVPPTALQEVADYALRGGTPRKREIAQAVFARLRAMWKFEPVNLVPVNTAFARLRCHRAGDRSATGDCAEILPVMSSRSLSVARVASRYRASPWLLAAGLLALLSSGLQAAPLLLLAEDFEFTSNWDAEGHSGTVGNQLLRSNGSTQDALTMIEVPQPARYAIWTHSVDFATDHPGARRYLVLIDGTAAAKQSGQHHHDGLRWERVADMELNAGTHVVALRDFNRAFARCDAILLAPPGFDPEVMTAAQLQQYRVTPVPMAKAAQPVPTASPVRLRDLKEVAMLSSDSVRIGFEKGLDTGGHPLVVRQLSVKRGSVWQRLPLKADDEQLSYLYSSVAGINVSGYFPLWTTSRPVTLEEDGRSYLVSEGRNPFMAGERTDLQPVDARAVNPQTVEVTYAGPEGPCAIGTWSLEGKVQRLSVALTVPRGGFYSLVFSPFQSRTPEQVTFVQLPPVFQMKRLPKAPVMVTSSETPHALALAQAGDPADKGPLTCIVAADPRDLPFTWATASNAGFGFSLLNRAGMVQPTAFSPVLGLGSSRAMAGQQVTARFAALALPGDWKSGLETASRDLFRVTDYRKPVNASLTEAALNMIDLLKDASASGWDSTLKGNYNIEEKGVATQVAPLSFLSAALLMRDVDFYAKRSLPALEFTLSRRQFHYAVEAQPGAMYVKAPDTVLRFPGWQGAPTYWRGVYEMTGELNPWIRDMALGMDHEGTIGGIPRWTEMLGLYQLDPSPARLAAVERECAAWIAQDVDGQQTQPLGIDPFYNRSFYPYWWDLLDLYEITQNPKYLDAAQEGAFGTLAGLWSHPMPPEGSILVNKGGEFGANSHIWWKGMIPYRLGVPRRPGDTPEHKIPAWEVCQVGLGLEQPCTYIGGGAPNAGMNNIQNSTWAPSLLRVYQATGREIYRTYARNTIVGRFANYPGYYLHGYTDLMTTADYPCKGPDVTSLYYHHIPVHLGFTLDYLFAQAEQLSGGKISFPWTRQQGYVWFNNREFGFGTGKVYGDLGMRAWLDRNAFSVDSHQVDYLGALGPGVFDILLMNAGAAPVHADLNLDGQQAGVQPGASCDWIVNGNVTAKLTVAAHMPFDLHANSAAVIRFKTAKVDCLALPWRPLPDRPVAAQLPSPWGQLHAVRIRSPFGQDSVYAFLTGTPPVGSEASLVVTGAEPVPAVKGPPYEFSIFPVPIEKDVTFHLVLQEPRRPPIESPRISLLGTR